ncbi:AAA family ATPase [Reinekea marina]|uniref:ExeA family protein n=1 Tax=Reinekea marina TaxID=1310421 RepID=A0ABV7WPK3_9GAMM|nr:AAA family ATPase [Reinekea marina]MBU2863494.1 AAA family ATPase [Reinekea forsetii]MDN3650619.1 AAA family ATPase [Reinekea marina]
MYQRHFGLTKQPFSLTPDTGLFVNLPSHEQCFELMAHVLASGEGFLKVIGDVGTGKTILCRKLLRFLDAQASSNHRFHTVYIPNPMLSPVGLYRAVGQELGLDASEKRNDDALLQHINERVLSLATENKSVVIVVDESQSLPPATLEALRLISNLETEERKLVQIILFGQTELDDLLNQDRFRQLKQRISFGHYLTPLDAKETRQYIQFRLQQCGYNGHELFSDAAIKKLHKVAQGIPRMINVLAHKSMMAAYAEQKKFVEIAHVMLAADVKEQRKVSTAPILAGTAFIVLLAALVWRLV